MELQKQAILGIRGGVNYFKSQIELAIKSMGMENISFPDCYPNLKESLFSEIYGFSFLTPWINGWDKKLENSSSAKLIGSKIFCLIEGKAELMPYEIPQERREKLKRALLLAAPNENQTSGFHEIYMKNGIRITIFSGERTKENEEIIVLRKYLYPCPSLEEMVELGTIPQVCVDLFKSFIKEGKNVIFSGAVRSGKTTFLRCWQSYESPVLEGLALSTDPETPWHEICKGFPIMQLVADGERLENITKSILRGDNDYVLMEEMRDALAYKICLELLEIGTKRSKVTIHHGNTISLPYKIASKVRESYGGEIKNLLVKVFEGFDVVIHLSQRQGENDKKVMDSIHLLNYDSINDEAELHVLYENTNNAHIFYDSPLLTEYQRMIIESMHFINPPQIILPQYYRG